MRRNYKLLVLVLLFAAASCSFTTKTFNDPNKDKTLIELIAYVLKMDIMMRKILMIPFLKKFIKIILKALDPLKRYFYASDIEEFQQYKDSDR